MYLKMNKKLLFLAISKLMISELLASKLCSDLTSNALVLSYCKNGSKCIIDNIGDTGINNQITCECLVGYSLPDCSLQAPETEDNEDNETRNTCWLEDVLQLNQEHNNFAIYKHIFSV